MAALLACALQFRDHNMRRGGSMTCTMMLAIYVYRGSKTCMDSVQRTAESLCMKAYILSAKRSTESLYGMHATQTSCIDGSSLLGQLQ